MKVNESAFPDLLAHWWLPESPKHRVPGRLTWDPDRGGDLQLMGELRESVILDNRLAGGSVQEQRVRSSTSGRRYPVILGSHTNSAGYEEAFTLLNSLSLNSAGFRGLKEFPEHVSVGALLHGAWYAASDVVQADRAMFALTHLSDWVNLSGVRTDYPQLSGKRDAPSIVITAHDLPAFRTTHDDATIELRQQLAPVGDQARHSNRVDETWELAIEIEPMAELERFSDIAFDIRALVTIGVGKTADIVHAVLQHPEIHERALSGTPMPGLRGDITYLNRWAHQGSDISPVNGYDLFFDLDQFGGAPALRRWLTTAATYRTELRRVMATRYTESMYLEDRIMNTSAALERFDKVRRPDAPKVLRDGKWQAPSFVNRMVACVEYAGPGFTDVISEEASLWAKRVKSARNQLAHHDDPFRITGRVGDHVLVEQLYWLFVMCLFRECEAPSATFESIRRHGQIRWLAEQAHDHRDCER
ncbi:hypothetical protein AFL01nite_02990 [Aeromicrobium flavum]|uniref:ApeA N-terminal domain-containing protein n=1 Tax=Aeromicrobium flavum TaxID=416568 RepID=A0A512HR88_9ACTN|nr:HEPN domain-containing protein [Aeromicrobium flavum]GEO87972.1 hypothetical protein AFL01nite_02990 [Aeromicrobium flavum]